MTGDKWLVIGGVAAGDHIDYITLHWLQCVCVCVSVLMVAAVALASFNSIDAVKAEKYNLT